MCGTTSPQLICLAHQVWQRKHAAGPLCEEITSGGAPRRRGFSARPVESFPHGSEISSIPLNFLQLPQDLAMLSNLEVLGDWEDF